MTIVRACAAAALTASMGLLIACPTVAPPPAPQTSEGTGSKRADATPPASPSVKAPIFSADPCESDQDCAPAHACHADQCGSIARMGPKPSDMICTMECRAGTVDCGYNHCGCVSSPSGKKLCALLPGPDLR